MPSATGPIAVRVSRRTGWPTSSSSRRTIRLRPSWMTSSTIDRPVAVPVTRPRPRDTVDRAVLERRRRRAAAAAVAVRDLAVDLGDVGLVDLVRRVRHPLREVAVVGEQEQPLGVGVEPADVEEPLGPVGDEVARASGGPPGRPSCETTPRGLLSTR